MNHWQYEQYIRLDELSRQRVTAEIKTDRLVRQYRIYHSGIFEQAMFMLATRLISTGKGLRSRHEIPSTNCRQTALHNFVK